MPAAQAEPAVAVDPVTGSRLGLRVGGRRVALSVADVAEIARALPWTPVPQAPAALLGLVLQRGRPVPLFSLAVLLGGTAGPPGPGARMILLAREPPVGLLVDEVLPRAPADEPPLVLGRLLAAAIGPAAPAGARPAVAPARAPVRAPPEDRLALITLALDGQDYGWRLSEAEGVARLPPGLAVVPGLEPAMLGVADMAGRLVPLVRLRSLLALPPAPLDPARARILLTRLGETRFGLVVDAVGDIVRVPGDAVDPVPAVLTRGGEARVEAICRADAGRRLICLLGAARLFDEATASRLRAQAGPAVAAAPLADETLPAVVFAIAAGRYGLPAAALDEVLRCPARLDDLPGREIGMIQLRGRVIPVFDPARLLDRRAGAGRRAAGAAILVLAIDGTKIGLRVDGIPVLRHIPAAQLRAAPPLPGTAGALFDRLALGQDDAMTLLLEPRALLAQIGLDLAAIPA